MKTAISIILITIIFLPFVSCKKNNYIVGGIVQDTNMYKQTSTYDVLNSIPGFDTLVQLIDAAGFKDKINANGTTFFAPANGAIYKYLSKRTLFVQHTYDQYAQFGLDSLIYYIKNNKDGTRDSLLMYLINKPLTYDVLTVAGVAYPTQLANDTAVVSYEYTYDPYRGYSSQVSTIPQLVYYTHLWAHYDIDPSNKIGDVPAEVGTHTLVQTSGIKTQNGILNVLHKASHILFFRK